MLDFAASDRPTTAPFGQASDLDSGYACSALNVDLAIVVHTEDLLELIEHLQPFSNPGCQERHIPPLGCGPSCGGLCTVSRLQDIGRL